MANTLRFSPKVLEYYKKKLLALRRDVLSQIDGLEEDSTSQPGDIGGAPGYGMHLADAASSSHERDISMGVASYSRELLFEIDEALSRIEDGSFGICLGSGEPIPKERLEAVPYTKYTREYQEKLDNEKR
jgi:RNA polymerase-binding transcription factor DksA